jgi:hypothetical protein
MTRKRKPRGTRVQPHPFDPDPSIPVDHAGRAYCRRCRCAGTPGDARHPVDRLEPIPADVRELEARILGESDA